MPDEVKDAQSQDNAEDTSSDKGTEHKDDPLQKTEQKLASWIGRIEAQQKKDREAIIAKLNELNVSRETFQPQQPGNAQQSGTNELNQKWGERLLNGDVAGVLDEYTTLRQQAEKALAQRAQSQMDKTMNDMAEIPIFKDVKDRVRQLAGNLIGQGYSPQDAVAFAFQTCKAEHLEKLISGGGQSTDTSSLETLGGGSMREDAGATKGKLPPELKRAFERDRSQTIGGKPMFKDEKDYIAHLSPAIRKQYGL